MWHRGGGAGIVRAPRVDRTRGTEDDRAVRRGEPSAEQLAEAAERTPSCSPSPGRGAWFPVRGLVGACAGPEQRPGRTGPGDRGGSGSGHLGHLVSGPSLTEPSRPEQAEQVEHVEQTEQVAEAAERTGTESTGSTTTPPRPRGPSGTELLAERAGGRAARRARASVAEREHLAERVEQAEQTAHTLSVTTPRGRGPALSGGGATGHVRHAPRRLRVWPLHLVYREPVRACAGSVAAAGATGAR